MDVTSPCIGVCTLDPVTNWCRGCGRDGTEIVDWRKQPLEWRDAVWRAIPERLAAMGVACQRLDWSTDDIRDFVARTCAEGHGTWVMGVVGAVAEFTAAPGHAVEISREGEEIVARTMGGALRMRIDDSVRALTFDPPETAAPRIVLAVSQEQRQLPVAPALTDLGPDDAALMDDAGRLFDLGLARRDARFCVRAGPGAAAEALKAAQGLSFAAALPRIGGPLLAASPVRVVESALGRLEVSGAIPPPGASSPPGPHTHLLPDYIATGRALPVGMDLPKGYLSGAIFYPPRAG
ncbi:MAG: DUF1289 domain-containing protein [Pseudomonadota bacterium]